MLWEDLCSILVVYTESPVCQIVNRQRHSRRHVTLPVKTEPDEGCISLGLINWHVVGMGPDVSTDLLH